MIYTVTNRWDFADNWVTLKDCLDYFKDHTTIAVDTETSGLSFITAKLYTIQIGDADHQYVIDYDSLTPEEVKVLIKFLESKEMIMHNSVFDTCFLYNIGLVKAKLYDTYLAEYVLSMGLFAYGRSLADVLERHLGVKMSKEQRDSIIENGMTSQEDIIYAAEDVKYLIPLKDKQYELICKQNLQNAVSIENEFARVNAYMEFCGIYLDKDKWHDRVRRAEYEEYGAWLHLKQLAESFGINPDINWASPKQVIEAFKSVGIDTVNKEKDGDSVDSAILKKQDHPLIKPYIDYKEKQKVVTTYGRNWNDYTQSDGRIHTKFKGMVDTARTSCGNIKKGPFPNLQNLSKDSDTRACFAGQRGNVLVIGDYSSQESILMAEFSKEPSLIKFFLSGGGDMHAYLAKQIFKDELGDLTLEQIKEEYPDLRGKAKAAGFAIQYGGTGYTIADNMNISVAEGDSIYEAYMASFPKLKDYFDETFKRALANGYIETNKVTKRKRFVDRIEDIKKMNSNFEYWDKYREEKAKKSEWYKSQIPRLKEYGKIKSTIYKLCLNTPIQSTAADMSKMAGILFLNWIIENKAFGKIKMVNFVHDEYVIECNSKSAEKVAAALKDKMEEAARFFVKVLSITVEPMISKYWKK